LKAFVITDLGFGDGGKGSVTDFLVRETGSKLVVKFSGGGQSAHNVCLPDGRHHTFSQFGSGTFVPGVRTYLSCHCLLDPMGLVAEEEHLLHIGVKDAWERLSISAGAMVVTPYHKALNRLRELARGNDRHGSCGTGVGEVVKDSIEYPKQILYAGFFDETTMLPLLKELRERKLAEAMSLSLPDTQAVYDAMLLLTLDSITEAFIEACSIVAKKATLSSFPTEAKRANPSIVIFEGSQGVLIDQDYGFHPYTTWSRVTAANAESLIRSSEMVEEVVKIGVIRAYMVRHGPGPFPTEVDDLSFGKDHNNEGPWQGHVRYGYLDFPLLRYAINANQGVDVLAVTCLDQVSKTDPLEVCTGYSNYPDPLPLPLGQEDQNALCRAMNQAIPLYKSIPPLTQNAWLMDVIETQLGAPVAIRSYGPTHLDKEAEMELL